MRRLFTAASSGMSRSALAWGVRTGQWTRVQRGVYAEGPEPPTQLDIERAAVLASGRPARGALAGVLLGFDAVRLDRRPTRRGRAESALVVGGVPCVDPLTALVDLAAVLDDAGWEQALESALRCRLVTIDDLVVLPPWTPGLPRIRRVLGARPRGAPPTESLLEAIALQLARPVLGEPVRQRVVRWPDGGFVARVDLCWVLDGVFFELDGQHHEGQPVYDARRETAVIAATGWLPGRFTWTELTRIPRSSQRWMAAIRAQAHRRHAA
jgi:hypothetical protein